MNPDINIFSNPMKVLKKAKQIFGPDVRIQLSTRKGKKYMIQNPETQQWSHFGETGYEDFTRHGDKQRQLNFQKRNQSWATRPKYSPAYLSYHLLW